MMTGWLGSLGPQEWLKWAPQIFFLPHNLLAAGEAGSLRMSMDADRKSLEKSLLPLAKGPRKGSLARQKATRE